MRRGGRCKVCQSISQRTVRTGRCNHWAFRAVTVRVKDRSWHNVRVASHYQGFWQGLAGCLEARSQLPAPSSSGLSPQAPTRLATRWRYMRVSPLTFAPQLCPKVAPNLCSDPMLPLVSRSSNVRIADIGRGDVEHLVLLLWGPGGPCRVVSRTEVRYGRWVTSLDEADEGAGKGGKEGWRVGRTFLLVICRMLVFAEYVRWNRSQNQGYS